MNWIEISVLTSSEAVEAVSNILMEAGASGVQIDDAADYQDLKKGRWGDFGEIVDPATLKHIEQGAKVSAYYPETVFLPELVPSIEQQVKDLSAFDLDPGAATVVTSDVAEEDWATAWKKYYHPVRVTRYLTIVPSWESYQPDDPMEKIIRLDPGMAFGTGTHPTTRLVLEALEMAVRGGENMIDVGTGSGVLSIAAKHMGVRHIHATDLDDVAVRSAKMNLDLNPVATDVIVTANDLLDGVDDQVPLIVANILAEIILPLVPQAWDHLEEGGTFITSGIIEDKAPSILNALENKGFKVEQVLKMKDWYGIIAKKPTEDD